MSDRGTRDDPRERVVQTSTWRWTLLLPPGWASLPVEPDAARAAIRALLDRRLEGLPRDQFAPLRIDLDRALRRVVADARDAGATAVHALVDLVRGLPVSASLAVSVVPLLGDDDALGSALLAALGESEGVVESGTELLDDLVALRRRRRVQAGVPRAGDPALTAWHTAVDWLVPTPDGDEALVLSFATVTEPVADELVLLFDAIASSLTLTVAGPA